MNNMAPIADDNQHTLGNSTTIKFVSVSNKSSEAKVDTGATVSSLHATNIRTNGSNVSFQSDALSPNTITLPLEGNQEVHSADAGGQVRPVVKFDIEVNGIPIQGATFNLNDRSGMDTMILIGQNVLKAGNFTVDVQKEISTDVNENSNRDISIMAALEILVENDVTLAEVVTYLKSIAINRLK